ncbi:hypothetical protein TRAPUB_13631 [Trametes pubescens]|uniref:Uncharacterized protein n=1 Tax=Trametes pubescens TaxID=154538 RepID=A0A1M2VQP9_TRAPU|nr:hypothetical protein TRAPUB_13631 [Trametes pubescens]
MSSVAFLRESQKGKSGQSRLIHDQVIESVLRRGTWAGAPVSDEDSAEDGDATATVSPTIAVGGQRTSELAEP